WTVSDELTQFRQPQAVAVDPAGRVFVSQEPFGVSVFEKYGSLQESWGSAGSGDDEFFDVIAMAADAAHVYALDDLQKRIQVFDSQGRFERSWSTVADPPDATEAPLGIALTPDGRIAVVASRERIDFYDPMGNRVDRWRRASTTMRLADIAIDAAGTVFVTADHQVVQLDPGGAVHAAWTPPPGLTLRRIATSRPGRVFVLLGDAGVATLDGDLHQVGQW